MHPPIYVFFIQISLLASLTGYFKRKTDFYLRLFPVFLLITGIVEVIGDYLVTHQKSNTKLYNFFSIFEFCFYLFVLSQIVQRRLAKRIVIGLVAPLFLLVALCNILLWQKNTFTSMTYVLGCLLIATVCIYYFFELFLLPHSVDLIKQPAFWICSGLLFYYACTFTIFGSANLLNKMPQVVISSLVAIIYLLNVFLYSSFTIAFLCRLKIRKSILLS